jgi:hypothetical protein
MPGTRESLRLHLKPGMLVPCAWRPISKLFNFKEFTFLPRRGSDELKKLQRATSDSQMHRSGRKRTRRATVDNLLATRPRQLPTSRPGRRGAASYSPPVLIVWVRFTGSLNRFGIGPRKR